MLPAKVAMTKESFLSVGQQFSCMLKSNFHGQLKMTVNKKRGHLSSFSSGARNLSLQSNVKLSKQAENDRVEQLRRHM